VLVVPGVLVRRSDMGSLGRRRGDLAPETQQFEEEDPNPVWALAQLGRLGLRLMTVSHPNLVGLIRITRSSTHRSNGTRERRVQNPFQVPAVMERIVSIGGHDICELHGPAL
jgi:hypothetical protein